MSEQVKVHEGHDLEWVEWIETRTGVSVDGQGRLVLSSGDCAEEVTSSELRCVTCECAVSFAEIGVDAVDVSLVFTDLVPAEGSGGSW